MIEDLEAHIKVSLHITWVDYAANFRCWLSGGHRDTLGDNVALKKAKSRRGSEIIRSREQMLCGERWLLVVWKRCVRRSREYVPWYRYSRARVRYERWHRYSTGKATHSLRRSPRARGRCAQLAAAEKSFLSPVFQRRGAPVTRRPAFSFLSSWCHHGVFSIARVGHSDI